MHRQLPPQLVLKIEELIGATFAGRDELYAAAQSLDDERRSNICKQLADHLAGHAAELQQLLAASGEQPAEPFDMLAIAESFFAAAKRRGGEKKVLRVAEKCELAVKERYDEAISSAKASDDETAALLQQKRDDIEFGEHVLRSMQSPPE